MFTWQSLKYYERVAWRFAIPSTCYYFGNRSKIARFHYCKKKKSTYFHEILIFFVIPSTSPSCNNFKRLMYQRKVEIWCQKSAYTIMRFWAIALNKLYRLIRNEIRKNLLCSDVRPRRSIWRPDSESAWNSVWYKSQRGLEDKF